MRLEFSDATRGQAHTVEAVLAALLILAGLLFAIQTTAVTPFSSTTTDKHLENQQREVVHNVVSITHASGAMKETVLNWNTSSNAYQGTGDRVRYYTDPNVDTPLLNKLSATLNTDQVAYNVNVRYHNVTGSGTAVRTQRLLRVGAPSNNAITVREPLTLHDTDQLPTGAQPELQNTGPDEFYMDTVNSSAPIYNQVEVEVVAWRR